MSTLLRSLLAVLCFASFARADGLIIVHDPPVVVPGHFRFAPLEVSYHHVNVVIDQGVAVTSVDQEFYNPNPQRLEGTYIFPLPAGATIDKFSMDIDGKMQDAELLSADKARGIYEDIVRRQRDPALLEYAGREAFKVRIFPIEPNSRKKVKLQYTQLLPSDNGMSEYVYGLNTEKFSSKPLQSVSIKVELKTATPLKSVYCPSHSAEIKRDGSQRAVAGFEMRNARPDTDFKLIWSVDKDPIGMNLLTWQQGEEGYFLLLMSPGMDVDKAKVQPKDICFVIDTSGSMAGPKLEQAKKALQFCLANLNENDRFEIVRFSTESEPLFQRMMPASKENLDKAQAFVKEMKPIGGTAIADALTKAMAARGSGDSKANPFSIIFLTDGQPTIGETNEDRLVSHVSSDIRLFPFGIGTDINTHLLDRLAQKTHAVSQYVLPEEDIEVKVSGFYTKIKEPVLSQLALSFGGDAKVSQLYPNQLPDLYKGETLTVFGKYTGNGPSSVKLTGTLNGEEKTFANDVKFVKQSDKYGFIPRLWATRRVGWLLDELRLRGQNKELVDEISRLAREFGIVTPYTSYLILEDEQKRNVPTALRTQRELNEDRVARDGAKDYLESASASSGRLEKAGDRAVTNAQAAERLRSNADESQIGQGQGLAKGGDGGVGGTAAGPARLASPASTPATGGYRQPTNYAQQARVVNGRAFYQNGNTWTDATAQTQTNLKQQTIKLGSDEYFALLNKDANLAAWLALGEEVDIVIGDTLVSVR